MAERTYTDYLRDHAYGTVFAGYYAREGGPLKGPDKLTRYQWSPEFEERMLAAYRGMFWGAHPDPVFIRAMKNRLLQGAFRYTTLHNQRNSMADLDHFGQVPRRLRIYLDTGNQEFLVDAANFCLTTLEVGWWPPRDRALKLVRFRSPITEELDSSTNERARWTLAARAALRLAGRIATMEVIPGGEFHRIAALAAYEWTRGGHPDRHFESANEANGIHMTSG
jgi:hypothetical protein